MCPSLWKDEKWYDYLLISKKGYLYILVKGIEGGYFVPQSSFYNGLRILRIDFMKLLYEKSLISGTVKFQVKSQHINNIYSPSFIYSNYKPIDNYVIIAAKPNEKILINLVN